MITAWRIVKAKYALAAFNGGGSRRGGRWNAPGVAMVYTAESAALAALEMLVNLGPPSALQPYVLMSCTFDDALVNVLDRSLLPSDWRSSPAPPALQILGHTWLNGGASPVLKVPSAVIETDSNYLLNPAHSDFAAISIAAPRPFRFDSRLLGI